MSTGRLLIKYGVVDHVDDLELLLVQLHRRRHAAILDDHDVEALIGKAAHRGGDALVGEDPGDHDVHDPHVPERQTHSCR